MGLDAISVEMKLKPGAAPDLEPAAFFQQVTNQWLPQFFTPRELRGFVDRAPASQDLKAGQRWHETELWQGEEVVDNFPLSHIASNFSLFKTAPLGAQIELQFYGGLHHRPPLAGSVQAWYGRIVSSGPGASNPWLNFIVTVRLDWNDFGRGIRVSFPFAGYPLTSVQPQIDESFAVQATPMSEIVEFNRETLFSIFRRLPQVLGSRPADLIYKVGWNQALFPGDKEALRDWESRLAS
jgi:hypothetical protein